MSGQPQLLLIDSRDRTSGTSANFSLQLPDALHNVKSVELVSASIPATIYNIDLTNNKFYFNDGTDRTITITSGSYTSITICQFLQSALNAIGATVYTVTYNETTFRLSITATNNFSLKFGTYKQNSVNKILGFAQVDTAPSTSIIADYALDLAEPDYYIIEIAELYQHCRNTKNDFGTFIIPCMNLTDGTTELFTKNTGFNYVEVFQNSSFSNLNIKLKTYNNKIIDLNGSEFYFIIKLTYYCN